VWLDRYLKGENRVIDDPAEKFLEPQQLKVFASLPKDEINTKIDETFVPKAAAKIPESKQQWTEMREGWLASLRQKTFAGWPKEKSPHDLKIVRKQEDGDLVVREYEFTSQEPFRLPLIVVGTPESLKQDRVQLSVVDQRGWNQVTSVLAISQLKEANPSAAEHATKTYKDMIAADGTLVIVAPRGVGPTKWADDDKKRIHIRRRFMLLGQTLAGMQVYDVLRAIDAIEEIEPDAKIQLFGNGDSAVIALYAALFSDKIAALELINPRDSHHEGPDFLNVLRTLDLPQAVALAAQRGPLEISTPNPDAWTYSREVADALGWKHNRLRIVEGQAAPEK
jgi:hypothetical protein